MVEMATGFLDRYGAGIVVAWGVLHFLLTALFSYALQAISDKTDAAPSWMCWVPILQMHPFVRATGTGYVALIAWVAVLLVAAVGSAMVSSAGLPGAGALLLVAATVGSLAWFAAMMWRLAEHREVSGWLGVLCMIPLLGIPAYLYIAFHDGLVRPSAVGLGVAALLSIGAASALHDDLQQARADLETHAAEIGKIEAAAPGQMRALLQSFVDALPGDRGPAAAPSGAPARRERESFFPRPRPRSGARTWYRYEDPGGAVRFVDRLDLVPPEHRAGARAVEMGGVP